MQRGGRVRPESGLCGCWTPLLGFGGAAVEGSAVCGRWCSERLLGVEIAGDGERGELRRGDRERHRAKHGRDVVLGRLPFRGQGSNDRGIDDAHCLSRPV